MPTEQFFYLYGGMMDAVSPESTESREEAVNRRMRELHAKKLQRMTKGRSGL